MLDIKPVGPRDELGGQAWRAEPYDVYTQHDENEWFYLITENGTQMYAYEPNGPSEFRTEYAALEAALARIRDNALDRI